MIVKVQIPIVPPNGEALIYGAGRSHMQLVDQILLPRWVLEATAKTGKAYFHAQMVDGVIVLGAEAPPQKW